MALYEVIVQNVGIVHSGPNGREAHLIYACYVDRSNGMHGRCAGEGVTLWKDGEIILEHDGLNNVEGDI